MDPKEKVTDNYYFKINEIIAKLISQLFII